MTGKASAIGTVTAVRVEIERALVHGLWFVVGGLGTMDFALSVEFSRAKKCHSEGAVDQPCKT